MIEKRHSHRIQLSTKTILSDNNVIHQGQLVNISMNGALIRLKHGTNLPHGSELDLTVYIDEEETPLQLSVEVVCFSFAMAGVKFTSYKSNAEARLATLMQQISSGPHISRGRQESIRRLSAENLHEE